MWGIVFSEGMVTLAAKIEMFVVTGTFNVFKIFVFQKCLSLPPACRDGMMSAAQALSAVRDETIHLSFRKKWPFFKINSPAMLRKTKIISSQKRDNRARGSVWGSRFILLCQFSFRVN